MAGLPDLLTVEEAARVLRIGRTKAYAMAVEWRTTHGKSGLPVVDFGNALRVPRCQLEAMVGAPITSLGDLPISTAIAPEIEEPPPASGRSPDGTSPTNPAPAVPGVSAGPGPRPNDASARPSRRPPRRRAITADQPTLPFAS
ncbi:MAG: helix-turn-helix domain-containing protein [Acidimicrobiales bacterium]